MPSRAELYMPASTFVGAMPSWSILVRSTLPAASLLPAVRDTVRSVEREAAVDRVSTMEDVIAGTVSAERIVATLLACFALLALTLASVGLYGVLAFTVAARRPELAIRSALGSSPAALIGLVGREGMLLVTAGVAAGLAGMALLQPVLRKFVFDVGSLSSTSCAAVLLVLLAVGAAAVAVPALRAARIDPIRTLRQD